MLEFEAFRESLRDLLPRLYDPDYRCPGELAACLRFESRRGGHAVQTIVLEAIAQMEPPDGVPLDARACRTYKSLHYHYVLGLSQSETADRLHMSVRNLQRVQGEAIHALARRLWSEHDDPGPRSVGRAVPGSPESGADAGDSEWLSQARVEVASVRQASPRAAADVSEVIDGVLRLVRVLAQRYRVQVQRGYVSPGLVAATHPAPLRQTLLGAIGRLLPIVQNEVRVSAGLQDGRVKVTVSGQLTESAPGDDSHLLSQIIAASGTSVDIQRNARHVFVSVRVAPPTGRRVAVVEDNPDMVAYYRRCTAGTTFRVVSVEPGSDALDAIAALQPDAVVLDVMLPHVDGWELLTQLRERAATAQIPVIICSVVREEELALALGAASFLEKPVRPGSLMASLREVLAPATAASHRAAERSQGADPRKSRP